MPFRPIGCPVTTGPQVTTTLSRWQYRKVTPDSAARFTDNPQSVVFVVRAEMTVPFCVASTASPMGALRSA
jgi:hypothetical protein